MLFQRSADIGEVPLSLEDQLQIVFPPGFEFFTDASPEDAPRSSIHVHAERMARLLMHFPSYIPPNRGTRYGEREMPPRTNSEVVHFKNVSGTQTAGVSCCIIAADEEGLIRRAIESVKDLADEVIVVDTGSGDGTVAAARGAGVDRAYAAFL